MSSQYIEFLCIIAQTIYKCYSNYVRGWAGDGAFLCQNSRLLKTVAATWTFRRNQKVVVKVAKAQLCHRNSCWERLVSSAVNINHESLCPHALPVHLERSPKGNSITVFFQCSRGHAHLLLTHAEPQLSHHFWRCCCDHDILKLKEGQPLQAEGRYAWHENQSSVGISGPLKVSLGGPGYSWELFCLFLYIVNC